MRLNWQPCADALDSLEVRTATLETTQFSTTTKLRGQVIVAATAGGFGGKRIIDPTGGVTGTNQPNATLIYRAALDLNTSFRGHRLAQDAYSTLAVTAAPTTPQWIARAKLW